MQLLSLIIINQYEKFYENESCIKRNIIDVLHVHCTMYIHCNSSLYITLSTIR